MSRDFATIVRWRRRATEAPRHGTDEQTRRQRVQARVQKERDRLEVARGESITIGFAFDAFSYDTDTGAPVLAAALGFRVFLFLVPYVWLFLIISGLVSDISNRTPSSMFVGRGIAHLTAKSVASTASVSEGVRVITLLLVAYALLLAARSFVKVLYIVHALVWGVPRIKPARPNRAALLFIAIVAVASGLAALIDKLRRDVPLGAIVSLVLYAVLLVAGWWYVSWWLPHRNSPPIALIPGAMAFALGSLVLEIATVVWLPRYLENKSQVYGTLGISIAILLWAYLLGRVMTLAAVLNASVWAHFGAESEHPIDLRRPSWRVPLLDDQFGRLWTFLFSYNDHDRSRPKHTDTGTGP